MASIEKPIEKLVGQGHWQAALFAIQINVFSLALLGFWTPMNNLILPSQITTLGASTFKGTVLGAITFIGLAIAAVVQPVVGRFDDRIAWPHRRQAFIAAGAAGALVGLLGFALAPSLIWLLVAYLVIQISLNVSQAAFQALIPDLVKPGRRGLASGIKNGLGVLGAALGLLGVGLLTATWFGVYGALAYLALLLGGTAYLSLRWVPDVPLPPEDEQITSIRQLHVVEMFKSFYSAFTSHRAFRLAVLARFLFMLGLYPLERLFVYYLDGRFDIQNLSAIAIYLLGAILVAAVSAWIAGTISDRVGQLPVLRVTVVLGTIGVLGVAFSPWLWLVGIAGAVAAGAFGGFQAVNWAQLADTIPPGKSAEFFGLANIATAGAGAFAGIFGPLSDLLGATLPAGTYVITFGLAALIAYSSLLVLRHLDPEAEQGQEQQRQRQREQQKQQAS